MKNKLSLGFSPCPNDCFIFDALVNGKIDTEGLLFDVCIADVEELNKRACSPTHLNQGKEKLDISKLSFAAYFRGAGDYILLNSGSALGFGVGPLLISKESITDFKTEIPKLKIAIPGKFTTASFLFSLAFPTAKNINEMLFSEIEESVLKGKADAGVIIHENRFTYQQKGLKKVIDLGEWWEKQTGAPIPLGGIAIKRNIHDDLKQKADRIIRKSVEYAFANPESSIDFVKKHAQEMNDEVIKKHIGLYVNKYSVDLGPEGKKAVEILRTKAFEKREAPSFSEDFLSR